MLAKTQSVAFIGAEARLVDVELHVTTGLPGFAIVGLPTTSVKEAEHRTRSALASSGEQWPKRRTIANLAPGALRKDGTHFDLPIALGILVADERLPASCLEEWVIVGELALDGEVRGVPGVLPAAIACRRAGKRGVVCPGHNAVEASLVDGVEVVGVRTLPECLGFFRDEWSPPKVSPPPAPERRAVEDMSEVRGQDEPKRALEIAAAGGHNALLAGPPGSGKTMLARRLPGILPPMSMEESLAVTQIYSIAGLLADRPALVSARPFRAPHHNVSVAGLVGGGAGLARPGEISLAQHGVLFLDELPLYKKESLESLRGPLEDGIVRIARSGGVVTYSCRFSLVAAMNPCPCGYYGDARVRCRCMEREIQAYGARISGPLLDRFDVLVKMDRLTKRELFGAPEGETSATIRDRVENALALQQRRYRSSTLTNASAPQRLVRESARVTEAALAFVSDAVEGLLLSGRGVDRTIRVARTVADLCDSPQVLEEHVGEALKLRFDRRDEGVAA